ncbi:MAG: D-cysteine desulfhydrase [Rhodospirillaceae bacterium]|nr:D-cysteine desulfhydrase [Rhodospirillales bacterium]MBT4932753.1 D-cysteine desulfhydrase [Rhodospirillaceae bacterium]MBT5243256.1 D-cysteine desulfhydrase [Rhodospirillaceae bacterium]MBT5563960.1 D-cysteine desulfhydrase [Rhodospirillaceae bacterium]MBT6240836.1 D-cysteine desulfhydrase [Rhodospirillaceae bacterium]
MDLTSIPRVQLAHLPTPLEPLETLSRHLDGPDIYVKRDDCTGLAGGGNKTRKLEFLMADALEQGADTIVTAGATQSNHVRQSIAAAAKMGMHAEVLLEVRTIRDDDYAGNGNIILDNLMGAKIHYCDPVDDLNADCQALADKLAGEGAKPYFIPVGGSNKIGALGYADCASEIIGQSAEMGLAVDGIVVASGSQGTQGGLLVGLAAGGSEFPVHGICVSRDAPELEEAVFDLAKQTALYAGLTTPIERASVICDDGYYAPGYGQPNDGMIEAVTLCARLEGLLLDPVYSGKAMSGLIGKIRNGTIKKGDTVIFIHTGGQVALHAYRSTFEGL